MLRYQGRTKRPAAAQSGNESRPAFLARCLPRGQQLAGGFRGHLGPPGDDETAN